MSGILKTLSTGGLGDSYIVLLKLVEAYRAANEPHMLIDALHIESNSIVPNLIKEYVKVLLPPDVAPSFTEDNIAMRGINFYGLCDTNYEKKIRKGRWKDRQKFNTSWHGRYDFPDKDGGLKNPFLNDHIKFTKHYDVCIQVSGGAKNNNKKWPFDPRSLAKALRSKGQKVILVGADELYEDDKDVLNFVNKCTLPNTIGLMLCCQKLISFDGILTYIALSHKMPVLYKNSAPTLREHYFHPAWDEFGTELKLGSLSEILLQC